MWLLENNSVNIHGKITIMKMFCQWFHRLISNFISVQSHSDLNAIKHWTRRYAYNMASEDFPDQISILAWHRQRVTGVVREDLLLLCKELNWQSENKSLFYPGLYLVPFPFHYNISIFIDLYGLVHFIQLVPLLSVIATGFFKVSHHSVKLILSTITCVWSTPQQYCFFFYTHAVLLTL